MSYDYDLGAWDLSEILPEDMEAKMKEIDSLVTRFESFREKLDPEMPKEDFMEAVKLMETIITELHKISAGSYMDFSTDTSDADKSRVMSNVDRFSADMSNRMLFFSLWIKKGIDDSNFRRLSEGTGDYESYFRNVRRFRKFALDEPVEQMINIKDTTGVLVRDKLYDKLTAGFRYAIVIDGKEKEVNETTIRTLFQDPDPAKRKEAYEKVHERFSGFAPVIGELYTGTAIDWFSENIKTRRYPSPIAVRNFSNDIPDAAVDTLLQVCRDNLQVFHRYFGLKAKLCGIDGKISRTDIYAPIKEVSDKKYSFNEAVNTVMDCFGSYSGKVKTFALNIFEHNHFHSALSDTKKGGAYCYGMPPGIMPFVFQSFHGTVDDVSTMAHELGHAVHDQLCTAKHGMLTFHPSLPMAETGSIFAEMVLSDRMLQDAGDDKVLKKQILASQLDGAYKSIMRQAYFVLFEKKAHDMINSGQGASVEDLSDAYLDNLKEQFGDSVVLPDHFRFEWMSVPHIFHTPFYCYAYAFGQLLTLSLYKRFKDEGASFIPKYEMILSAGGAEPPAETLKKVGIDISSKDFWQAGFDILREKLDELEKLM